MNEVLANTQLDPARILTEAAIFADKVAVDEETVRLRSHLSCGPCWTRAAPPGGSWTSHPGVQPGGQHHRLEVQ